MSNDTGLFFLFTMQGFYVGAKGTLYYRQENGRLTRFGVRITPEGFKVFDQMQHEWYDLPETIETTGGGTAVIRVEVDE